MKQILIYIFIALYSATCLAQSENDTLGLSLTFDPFDKNDEIGKSLMSLLQTYERTGHLTDIPNRYASKRVITEFRELFEEGAALPDDLSHPEGINSNITLDEYLEKAKSEKYQTYLLFLEKGTVKAYRQDTTKLFRFKFRTFKLFSDQSFIGMNYERGAIYSYIFQLDPKTNAIIIEDIRVETDHEYFNFILGNYAYSGYADMRVTNKLEKLTQGIEAIYEVPKTSKTPKIIGEPFVSESGRIFQIGYQITNFMGPEAYTHNISDSASSKASEYGISLGLKFQKAFGRKGVFGIMAGIEYEYDTYSFKHNDLAFIYDNDYNGEPLKDLEGGTFDRKYVQVDLYTEQGHISYIRPEAGLIINIGMGPNANLALNGTVGYAYILTSSFENKSYLAYQGERFGFGDPITENALGFYDEYIYSNSGTITAAQSFANYGLGASIDFKVGEKNSLGFLVEYKNSFTPILESGDYQTPFLDPADFKTFNSQLNQLTESRLYESYGIHFYLKHHFMGRVKR